MPNGHGVLQGAHCLGCGGVAAQLYPTAGTPRADLGSTVVLCDMCAGSMLGPEPPQPVMPGQLQQPLSTAGTLLGYLAGTAWLRKHGEVLATHALSHLLQSRSAQDSFARLVLDRTGVRLPSKLDYLPEVMQDDRGRPDLEGRLGPEPVLVLEAKFEALLTAEQIVSYLESQQARLTGTRDAVLLVAVPAHRKTEATAVLAAARRQLPTATRSAVITWDDLLEYLAPEQPDRQADEDLRQFRGLCATYGGLDLLPLTTEDLDDWTGRAADFELLAQRATAALTDGRLMPWGREPDGPLDDSGYGRRYLAFGTANDGAWFCLGVRRPPGTATTVTPLWIRHHRTTPDLPAIRVSVGCGAAAGYLTY